MAVTARWYGLGLKAALNKEVDFDSDTIKVALLDSDYTPSQAHDYFDDVVGEEVSGAGYTHEGATLASKTVTHTVANSWASAWTATTAYAVGDVVKTVAGNGHLYKCIVAGTTHADTEPAWPTVAGQTVADNTATWAEVGVGALVLDAANTEWSASTITARYAVIYDATPEADSAKALLGYVDFGENKISDAGTFTITWDADGILRIFTGF